jgi:hypothetical protein
MRRNRRVLGILIVVVVQALAVGRVFAGPYTDELSKCLVSSTTNADRTLLVRWMFAMATLHPAVKSMATVSDSQRTELNRKVAGLMEHLLTVSCQSAARQAVKFEGTGAIEASFNVLGQVAGRELFSNPEVAAGLGDLEKFVDANKLKKALGTTK